MEPDQEERAQERVAAREWDKGKDAVAWAASALAQVAIVYARVAGRRRLISAARRVTSSHARAAALR